LQHLLIHLDEVSPELTSAIVKRGHEFRELFESINGWSIVADRDMATYAIPLLRLAQTVGNPDFFLDEWVLCLPASAPLFAIDRAVFAGLIVNGRELLFPSLLAVSPEHPTDPVSEYALYLMGRYSFPVFRTLGMDSRRLPHFERIAGRYIGASDLFAVLSSEPPDTYRWYLSQPGLDCPVLEFCPASSHALTPVRRTTGLTFQLWIDQLPTVPYALLSFAGGASLTVNAQGDVSLGGSSVPHLLTERMREYRVRVSLLLNDAGVYVDGMLAVRLPGGCSVEAIGGDSPGGDFLFYIGATLHLSEATVFGGTRQSFADAADFLRGRRRAVPLSPFATALAGGAASRLLDAFDRADAADRDAVSRVLVGLCACAPAVAAPPLFDRWLVSLECSPGVSARLLLDFASASASRAPSVLRAVLTDAAVLGSAAGAEFLAALPRELADFPAWPAVLDGGVVLVLAHAAARGAPVCGFVAFAAGFLARPRDAVDAALAVGLWDAGEGAAELFDAVGRSTEAQRALAEALLDRFAPPDLIALAWLCARDHRALAGAALARAVAAPDLAAADVPLLAEAAKLFGWAPPLFEAAVARVCEGPFVIGALPQTFAVVNPLCLPVAFAAVLPLLDAPDGDPARALDALAGLCRDRWDAAVDGVAALVLAADPSGAARTPANPGLTRDEFRAARRAIKGRAGPLAPWAPRDPDRVVARATRFVAAALHGAADTRAFPDVVRAAARCTRPAVLVAALAGAGAGAAPIVAVLSFGGQVGGDGLIGTLLSSLPAGPLPRAELGLCAALSRAGGDAFRAELAARVEADGDGYPPGDRLLAGAVAQGSGDADAARAIAVEEALWRGRAAALAGKRQNRTDPVPALLHGLAAQAALRTLALRQAMRRAVNASLRDGERRCADAFVARARTAPARSFRLGCFAAPMAANLAVLPSPMPIRAETVEFTPRLFGEDLAPIRTTVEDPQALYRFSGALPGPPDAPPFDAAESATLVRLDIRVRCVVGRIGGSTVLITHAHFDGGVVLLRDFSPALELAVLSAQFGVFSLYRGHFVITIPDDALLGTFRYTIACCPHAVELFTATAGSFILVFDRTPRVIPRGAERRLTTETDRWVDGRLTTLDYLLAVNFAGYRSFNDLSAYPVLPRVLSQFDPPTRRDLSLPIEVVADRDPDHGQMHSRFRAAAAHHKDGVSNPLAVATLLVRLAPFCHRYWETHGGWDQGGREFTSVAAQLSVNSQTAQELPAELFAVPEAFENGNRLEKCGEPLPMALPPPARDAPRFVEWHRSLLEEARAGVPAWLDLHFGAARDGAAAEARLNVFPAPMYGERRRLDAPDELALECGVIPARVFKEGHRAAMVLATRGRPAVAVRDGRPMRTVGGTFTVTVAEGGEVCVARRGGVLQTRVWHDGARFAVLWEEQMLCYTVCRTEIVVWCFANEQVIRRIGIAGVVDLIVSPERVAFFVAVGREVRQYSVNGEFVRAVVIGEPIAAMAVATVAVWTGGVVLAVAVRGGLVVFVGDGPAEEDGPRELAVSGDPSPVGATAVYALEFSEDEQQLFAYVAV
jgi:hypothetical protein